jgi:hypothetical protein
MTSIATITLLQGGPPEVRKIASPGPTGSTAHHPDMAGTPSESPDANQNQTSVATFLSGLRISLMIIAVFAVGSAAVGLAILSGPIAAIGIFVGFTMMLFIGLPLILASISDAISRH